MPAIVIAELSQRDADQFRNALPSDGDIAAGLMAAFVAEEQNLGEGRAWALSPSERIYFIVSLNGAAYLLIGINPSPPNAMNISSFARIIPAPKGRAATCLRAFIEAKLVPMCRDAGKVAIAVHVTTEGGHKVFASLKASPPEGIKRVDSRRGFWTLFLTERTRGWP